MFNGIRTVLTHRNTPLFHALLALILRAVLSSSRREFVQQLEYLSRQRRVDKKRFTRLIERKIDKFLPQIENSYMLPCVFMPEKRLFILPNTVCKGLSRKDKTALLASLRETAELVCSTTFRYGNPPHDSVNGIEWAVAMYNDHLRRTHVIIDAPLERFSAGKLKVGDFICEIKRALLEGGYVQKFVAELNTKASEIKASISRGKIKDNDGKMRAECESCRVYASSITPKSLAMWLRQQEMYCKVFEKVLPDNEDGLRLLIQIYNSPECGDSSILGCEEFDVSSFNIEKIFGLCEEYGEDVAAGALRTHLLNPNTELELDAEYILELIEKEARKREANADELVKSAARKKKTEKRAKKRASSEEEPLAAVQHSEEPVEKRILEIRPDEAPPRRTTRYRLLRRVQRWGGPLEAIKRSLDSSKDRRYWGQEMDEIKRQKDLHDFADAVHVLEEDDATDYFFRTERGMSALATLVIDGKKTEGILEVGVRDDKCTVYHLMFNPEKVRMEKVLSPEFEEGDEVVEGRSGDLRSEMWCRITRTRDCYVLKYTDPFEESQIYKRLVLHSYRARRSQ